MHTFLGNMQASTSLTNTRGSVNPVLPKAVDLFIYEYSKPR
jgi:hypothetical protein